MGMTEIMKNKRLIRLPDVLDSTGLGKTRIYQLIKEGKFPTAVKLGTRHVAWVEEEVQQWIEDLPRA